MRGQTSVMAIPCTRCGALFDLSYDLEGESTLSDVVQTLLRAKSGRAVQCWECRQR